MTRCCMKQQVVKVHAHMTVLHALLQVLLDSEGIDAYDQVTQQQLKQAAESTDCIS